MTQSFNPLSALWAERTALYAGDADFALAVFASATLISQDVLSLLA